MKNFGAQIRNMDYGCGNKYGKVDFISTLPASPRTTSRGLFQRTRGFREMIVNVCINNKIANKFSIEFLPKYKTDNYKGFVLSFFIFN